MNLITMITESVQKEFGLTDVMVAKSIQYIYIYL